MTHFLLSAFPSILAQAEATPGSLLGRPEVMIFVMIVMFYFLLIRPQQRQRKELAARISALQSGDRVVTSAGLHGLIHNVKEHTVMLKVAEGTMLEFDKSAVAVVQKRDAAK